MKKSLSAPGKRGTLHKGGYMKKRFAVTGCIMDTDSAVKKSITAICSKKIYEKISPNIINRKGI